MSSDVEITGYKEPPPSPESASGSHFLYRTFLKMVAEYAPISQEGSNFARQHRSWYCFLNFKRENLKCTKAHEFSEYLQYILYVRTYVGAYMCTNVHVSTYIHNCVLYA